MSYLKVGQIEITEKAGVPIGHPYIQLPGMPEPSEIYTGVWENVSADYAGDFFRVEGGNAEAFDPDNLTEQLDQMQGHWHEFIQSSTSGSLQGTTSSRNMSSHSEANARVQLPISDGVNGEPRYGIENRSINRTIRIWKKRAA